MHERPNIMLIVIDTLRKDYAKPIERLLTALGFIRYDNAIAPSPWTPPSHASIFTGLYPLLHGTHETKTIKDWDVRLKTDVILNSYLKNMGYNTFLLSANPHITPRFGFKGFDYFYDSWNGPTPLRVLSINEEKRVNKLLEKSNYSRLTVSKQLLTEGKYTLLFKSGLQFFVRRLLNPPYQYMYRKYENYPINKGANKVISYVKRNRNIDKKPFFIFINFMEVHEPYYWKENSHNELLENLKTNKPISSTLIKKWKTIYPKEVDYIAKKINILINILKQKGIFDDTLIIVTSDHGQLLGEHGRISHGTFLYDELLRVPLLIKYPIKADVKITNDEAKYISIKQIAPLIISLVKGKLSNDSILYSDVVFSESYGIQNVYEKPITDAERKNINHLEKYRIAIYYKDFKAIFNVNDWRFEEIMSYNPDIKVSETVSRWLKTEVIKFLKMGTVIKKVKVERALK